MGKKKLQRFAEIELLPNVFHHPQYQESMPNYANKGKWNINYFKNTNPIVLELGCGRGEYTTGLAKTNSNKNFIGIDIKGNRIWKGATTAIAEKLTNVAFLRTRIDIINTCFSENEIDEIWITFPDPQPQKSRERKRLTSPKFLSLYKNILKKNGVIHLKTDNFPLYQYTLETIHSEKHTLLEYTNDLYGKDNQIDSNTKNIKTYYENLFSSKGFKICYIKFRIN